MSLFVKVFLCFEITCNDLLCRAVFFFDGIKFPKSLFIDFCIYLFLLLKVILIFLQVNINKAKRLNIKTKRVVVFIFIFRFAVFW